MLKKRCFHWYIAHPFAHRESLLTPRLIRETYDRIFSDMAAPYGHNLIVNTPLLYALIKKDDECIFEDMQARASISNADYLESDDTPQILAISEERSLEISDLARTASPVASRAFIIPALRQCGAVADGPEGTFSMTSNLVAEMMCDCSQGVPTLSVIALSYQAPVLTYRTHGHLADITALNKLTNRASSL
jgi:hypothetical protein